MEKSIDPSSKIEYENKYFLRYGSHRLAYYYFYNIPFILISCMVNHNPNLHFCNYSINWFLDKFSNEELSIIKNELKLL